MIDRAKLSPTEPPLAESARQTSDPRTVIFVFVVALLLRLPWLGQLGLHGDEDITMLAARGVLTHGLPELPSGSLYLRSPIYTYLVAPLVATGIDWLPRLLSVLASACTAGFVVKLGTEWFGKRTGLVAGLFCALSLTEIATARTMRMYALYELFALVALSRLYLLWKNGSAVKAVTQAAAATLCAFAFHILGVTLWLLAGLGVVRSWIASGERNTGRPWKATGVVLGTAALFGSLAVGLRKLQRFAIDNGGQPAVEPVAPLNMESTLQARIADDPFAFGAEALGHAGLTALVVGLAVLGTVFVLWPTRLRLGGAPVAACAAVFAITSAALAHQLGVAFALLLVLILLRTELLPGSAGAQVFMRLTLWTAVVSAFWIGAAVASGSGLSESLVAFVRWPARLVRLFLWPPALALLAVPGFVAVLIRSWMGKASDAERFLVLTILLLTLTRGLLSGRTHLRYLVEVWPLWGMLAAWSLVRMLQWLEGNGRIDGARWWMQPRVSLGFLPVAAAVLLLPGTGLPGTFHYLRLNEGESARTGLSSSFHVADLAGAGAWLRPKLAPSDRVIATNWLSTYCYVGRVDAWSRHREWAKQSRVRDGVPHEIYLGAQVLPDLEALREYIHEDTVEGETIGTVWFVVGAEEWNHPNDQKLDPRVKAWLETLDPEFVAADGATQVYRLDRATKATRPPN